MKHLTHLRKRVAAVDVYILPQIVSKGLSHQHRWGDPSIPLNAQRCLICDKSRQDKGEAHES